MSSVKRYQPGQPGKPRASRFGGMLIYILGLPLLPAALFSLIGGSARQAIGYGIGFFAAMVAATMIRRGITIEAEAQRRKIVRRSSTVPYKFTGSAILAVGMFVVALASGYSLIEQILFAGATLLGGYLYYGFDPTRKNPELAAVGITSEELIELLEEAELKIENIEASRGEIRNPEFRTKLQKITEGAREILDTIEEDPTDARKARKFLKVYLDGAQPVSYTHLTLPTKA